jgi:imidazolonepropionase-like amidohydrolase
VDAKLAIGGITAPGGHPEKLYEDVLAKYVYTDMKPEQMVGDAFNYVTQPADIDPVMDKLVAEHTDFVKIFLLYSEDFAKRKDDPAVRGDKGLDPKLVPAIVAAAHKRGLKVAAHIETAADFRVVVAAGVDEAAHMPGYVALEDPVSKYAITDADATAAAKAHISVVTTAWLATVTRDAAKRLPEVQAMQRANLQKLQAAGVPLILGTDGDADSVIKEAQYLVGLGVIDALTALRLLSVDTPRYIFPERKLGALEPGYEASFLVLSADPAADIGNLRKIDLREKQGLELAAPTADK